MLACVKGADSGTLTTLNLCGVAHLSDVGLASALGGQHSIQVLNLRCCAVGDATMACLAGGLSGGAS